MNSCWASVGFFCEQQSFAKQAMKFGLVGMSHQQPPVGGLRQIILAGGGIQVRQIALRGIVTRRKFDPRLQFGYGGISLAFGSEHSPQLNVNRRRLRMHRKQLPQRIFRLGKTAAAHVEIGQSDDRVGRP
jgi:hypothetical protein